MTTDGARKVAAFDFDGTLTKKDTLVPFMGSTAGWPRLLGVSTKIGFSALRGKVDVGDRDEVKAEMLRRLFVGHEVTELRRRGGVYAKAILDSARI
ncbi:MAG TPA: hypothetical protein VL068_06950, partial [Microthrixaceae bacterium]|nr:hypothetical protein [Microthrixaceae bacterium]